MKNNVKENRLFIKEKYILNKLMVNYIKLKKKSGEKMIDKITEFLTNKIRKENKILLSIYVRLSSISFPRASIYVLKPNR